MDMECRLVETGDALAFLELSKELDESGNMLYAPGEREISVKEQEEMIRNVNEDRSTDLFISEENEEITGFIMLRGSALERARHCAYIALGVKESQRGKGTGKQLLRRGFRWARERGVTRLELTVLTHNAAAIHLYRQMGFKIEGEKVNSLKIEGEYINEYYMYKLLK